MRCCPKCGETFADTDFRTICASCMVALVTCDDATVKAASSAVEPVAVGVASTHAAVMPEIVVPQISIPEVSVPDITRPAEPPSEVPQIPPAPSQPEPGPMQPPFTPTPSPDEPQPPIIPTPAPTPTPEPAPSEPMPTSPHSGKIEQAPLRTDTPPQAATSRKLTPDEVSSGKTAYVLAMVGGVISVVVALSLLLSLARGGFSFFTVVLTAGFVYLTVRLISYAGYRSAVGSVELVQQPGAQLGAPLRFHLVLTTLCDLKVANAAITLTAVERVTKTNGNTSALRHTLFSQRVPVHLPANLPREHRLCFYPEVFIADEHFPSFSGDYHHLEWVATLHIGLQSWYPDIRRRVSLVIPPLRAGQHLSPAQEQTYSLPELQGMHASITLDCALDAEGIPLLPAGRSIPCSLHIAPEDTSQDIDTLWVELSYLVHSANANERRVADQSQFFQQGWKGAGITQTENRALFVPGTGPITYHGKHMRAVWMITVRRERARLVVQRQVFEVRVVPEDAG